mgnify:CR=1 FL=1
MRTALLTLLASAAFFALSATTLYFGFRALDSALKLGLGHTKSLIEALVIGSALTTLFAFAILALLWKRELQRKRSS